MKIIYARQPIEIEGVSIFLAGPTIRYPSTDSSWRVRAIEIFREKNFDGTLLYPEDEKWGSFSDEHYYEQIGWEDKGLSQADCILFWIPRDLEKLPGFTTNDEFGYWKQTGKVVLGVPPNTPKTKYQIYYANKFAIPFSESLEETIDNAITLGYLQKKWKTIC